MNKVSFTSPGLNYFQAIVPKVAEFKRRFLDTGQIKTVEEVQSAVSITDPEARFMKNKKERIELSYNSQITVDHDYTIRG